MISNTSFQAENNHLSLRHRTGKLFNGAFFLSTLFSLIALVILLLTILNRTAGLVAYVDEVDPKLLSAEPLENLTKEQLSIILKENISKNRYKKLDTDQSIVSRSQEDIYGLVISEVVQPVIKGSANFDESIFSRTEVEKRFLKDNPNARIGWHFWLNPNFITNPMSSTPEQSGIRVALLGSLWIIFLTIIIAVPIGVGAAIYLEEYAVANRINRIIQTNIDNLAGVPSIIYGILGLAIFVRGIGSFTSGEIFGIESQNGRTIISAALTMVILILPILIINSQEAIRAVPNSLREASYGLGATKWQTIWHHVLPMSLPGILTGSILAISRAIGETAPLILIGASSFVSKNPNGIFSSFSVIPIQIYNWTSRPQPEFRNASAAAIIVLLIALLSLNAVAIVLRNQFSRR